MSLSPYLQTGPFFWMVLLKYSRHHSRQGKLTDGQSLRINIEDYQHYMYHKVVRQSSIFVLVAICTPLTQPHGSRHITLSGYQFRRTSKILLTTFEFEEDYQCLLSNSKAICSTALHKHW